MREIDADDLRAFLHAFEDDLAAVGGHVEIADAEIRRKLVS